LTDEERAGEWFDAFKEEFTYPGAEEVTTPRLGVTYDVPNFSNRLRFQIDDGQEIDRVNTVIQYGRYIAAGTFDTVGTGTRHALPTTTNERVNALIEGTYADLIGAYDERNWAGEVGQEARRVTPWVPVLETVGSFGAYLAIIGGKARLRYRVDPEQMAAENPGVKTALFGNFSLSLGVTWAPVAVYFDVRDFADQEASDEYFERLPDLFQTYDSGDWIFNQSYGEYVQALASGSGDSELLISHLEHAATWNPAEGVYLVGTHIATQVGTTVFGIGAFVPFTGDAADFAELDPRTDPSYERLRGGVSELVEGKIAERNELIASTTYFLTGLGQHALKVPEQWR
jgi:hypothetical protein